MKNTLRYLLVVSMILLLAACKKDQQLVDDTDTSTDTRPVVDTQTIDPFDYTDPRNLDNPESLLSKRLIYFDYDSSIIRQDDRAIIAAHSAYANANASARITLEGHADERGSREYNLGLGERRGNAVESALRAGGNQVNVVSYGEERPTCNMSTNSCWQNNRRVEIVYTAR